MKSREAMDLESVCVYGKPPRAYENRRMGPARAPKQRLQFKRRMSTCGSERPILDNHKAPVKRNSFERD